MTQPTRITARQFEATDGLRAHIARQVGGLDRLYDGIHDARVVLEDDAGAKLAELALRVHRQTLTASADGPTHETAVSAAVRQMRRRVLRYKARLRRRRHA
ncbi:MAG: HPF/RaiA family ribosome-associated protein [Bacteroidota bacterium]